MIIPWDRHLDLPNINGVDPWLTDAMLTMRRTAFGLDNPAVLSFAPQVEFISLGCFCALSRALQSLGLKRYSYPFDWTRSPMEGIIHCLDTNFEDFLTFSAFRYEGELKVYENARWGGSFWHHDLEAPGTQEDFVRRIARLYGRGEVEAATARFFVRAVNSTREVEQAKQLQQALQRACPQAEIYLLLVIDLQSEKGPIRLADESDARLLIYRIHESLYTQVLSTQPNLEPLQRIQVCSDWYAEAISFACRYFAGDLDARAMTKTLQNLAEVSAHLEQWDGGSAAYQLFCPRKFRGHQITIAGATMLPALIDPLAFCDFKLPDNVVAGQLLLVHAFGKSLQFQMPIGVALGQWLRVSMAGGAATGQVIWPSMPASGQPVAALTTIAATTAAAATSSMTNLPVPPAPPV
jgi:hypothetical protein